MFESFILNCMKEMYIDDAFPKGNVTEAIPPMPYRSFEKAIALANDTRFGLGACLMSSAARLVKRFFEGDEAGAIWINDPMTDNYAGPFGGMKMTVGGRELGQARLDEFTQFKHVHWDIEGGTKDFCYPY